MNTILPILQVIVSVVLITLVLLQQGEAGLGSSFGQEGSAYSTRRGIEKHIFTGTIVFAILFIALSIINLLRPNF